MAGKKISELSTLNTLLPDDIFVVVDSSATDLVDKTKSVTYQTIIDGVDGIVPSGGEEGYVLTKITSADYDYEWGASTSGDMQKSVYDTSGNGVVDNSEALDGNQSSYYATSASVYNLDDTINIHIYDTDIHYDVSAIDHTSIQNIGTNSHDDIDTHIGTSGIHMYMDDSITTSASLWSSLHTSATIDTKEDYLGTGDNGQILATSGTDIRYWINNTIAAGNTAGRPSTPPLGFPYFDTDLGYQINYNGTSWVNSTGAEVDEWGVENWGESQWV